MAAFKKVYLAGIIYAFGVGAWSDTPVTNRAVKPPAQTAPDGISLEQAIQLALSNNREIMSSRIAVASRKSGVALSQSAFRTTVRPDGDASMTDASQRFFYGLSAEKKLALGTRVTGRAGYQSNDVEGGERQDGATFQIEVSQPLFRRMDRETIMQPVDDARSDLRQAERLLVLRQAAIMLDVFRSYEQVLLLERRLASAEASVQRLNGLMELSKAREAQGRQNRVDSLRVELQQGQAAVRLANDREQLAAERENLQDLLNVRFPVTLNAQNRKTFEIELPSFEKGVSQALAARLDYANVLEAFSNSDRKYRIASRRSWPDIELTSNLQQNEDGLSVGDDETSWFAGLRLGSEYTPYDDRQVIRQASNNRALARLEIESMKFAIGREVRAAFRTYRRARAERSITGRNLELAAKRQELAQALFDLGRGDNFSVTDAEDALIQAETAAFAAEAEVNLSSYRVMSVLGVLVEAPDYLKPVAEVGGEDD